MHDDLERVSVRLVAETAEFRREIESAQAAMSGGLAAAAATAGRGIETALARAARTGRLEVEDLAKVAARALGELAASLLTGGVPAAPARPAAAGLGGLLANVLGGLFGLPGRATGGPVAPGRAYVVGERGPELFVPTSSGRVETGAGARRGAVTVHVHVAVPPGASGDFMVRSANQVARAVRRTLERQED
jgi:hypothetical protein